MNLGTGFTPGFFSMDDIIAEQIRVPCKTEVEIPGFGFLEPSLNREDLPAGLQLELPLWVVKALTKSRRYVSIALPSKYQETYREVLKADATVVDLNKIGPYFYQSGVHLASLPHNQQEQLAEILPTILKNRLQKMSDSYTFNTKFSMTDEATQKEKGNMMKETEMDALEQQIYEDAKNCAIAMKYYLTHSTVSSK